MWINLIVISSVSIRCTLSIIIFAAFLDYNATNQSLLFRAGETCVDIEIMDDFEVETTEHINTYLTIATATGAKVLHGCDRIDIYDNDGE